MLGTKIVMDEAKIQKEGVYDLAAMYVTIDEAATKLDFTKRDKYTYVAKDDKYALAHLGIFCYKKLMKSDWFIDNVFQWIWLDDEEGNSDMMKDIKEFRKQNNV